MLVDVSSYDGRIRDSSARSLGNLRNGPLTSENSPRCWGISYGTPEERLGNQGFRGREATEGGAGHE